jgi:hypothetical protein
MTSSSKDDEKKSIERRVFGINRDAEDFRADVKAVVEKISPSSRIVQVEEAVSSLTYLWAREKPTPPGLQIWKEG